jgi:hypothetical protein
MEPSMYVLAFFRDTLAAGAMLRLDAGPPRVLYVRTGSLSVRAGGTVAALAPNSAWHGCAAAAAAAGKEGADVYRWELHRGAAPAGAKLASPLAIDPAQQWLMRCDRVDFPLGGIAWTHTHQGPGTRCTLTGEMRVASAGHELRAAAGEPWFESGPDPVLAHASESVQTSFARVMILPAALLGKSSIRYVLPEDQDKPKRQTYQLFIDEPIRLP